MQEPQLNETVPVVNDDNHPDMNTGGRGGRGRRCRPQEREYVVGANGGEVERWWRAE